MQDNDTTLFSSTVPPEEVDAILQDLARDRAKNDYLLGGWLLRADALQLERLYGYASLREYCEHRLRLKPRTIDDRLRVARELAELPQLSEALNEGRIGYTEAREFCRVATPETEATWLTAADGKGCTDAARMVAGRARGDLPSDAPKPVPKTHRVTMTLSPEAYALLGEARKLAVARAGKSVDDDAFVRELALAYLNGGGARDPSVSAYQIALTVDPHDRAVAHAGGEVVAVDGITLAMARCDAQHVGCVDGSGKAPRAKSDVPPKTRRQVVLRHHGRCAVPGCRNRCFVDLHHVVPKDDGGSHHPENLLTLCSGHHRASHDGALVICGAFSSGFVFTHADGSAYGSSRVDIPKAAVMQRAFAQLQQRGWSEHQARMMLVAVVREVDERDDLDSVMGLALRRVAAACVREEVAVYARCA